MLQEANYFEQYHSEFGKYLGRCNITIKIFILFILINKTNKQYENGNPCNNDNQILKS